MPSVKHCGRDFSFHLFIIQSSVTPDTLGPHGLQHATLPCPPPISRSLLMSMQSVMASSHLILGCPFLFLPSIFPSIRIFSSESVLCITWPKYWHFSFCIFPSTEYSVLISFRIDWFDFLAVQGTLKNLFHHCSLKASVLWHHPSLWFNSHIHT